MEEAGAVENIETITDVTGITALSIGLSDLSGSLGVPGQANHPSAQAAVDTLMAVAARKGIPVSLSVRGVEEARHALKKGARLASVGTLETVLYQALKGWLQDVTKRSPWREPETIGRSALRQSGLLYEVQQRGAKGTTRSSRVDSVGRPSDFQPRKGDSIWGRLWGQDC
jgi:hypothetical protein